MDHNIKKPDGYYRFGIFYHQENNTGLIGGWEWELFAIKNIKNQPFLCDK